MAGETVLVACRDTSQGVLLGEVLARAGHRWLAAHATSAVLDAVGRERPELLLLDADLDVRLPDFLPELFVRDRDLGVLVILWETDPETAVQAARLGVLDFITKPFDRDKIPIRLTVAAERRKQALSDRAYKLALEKRINARTWEVWDKKERLERQLVSTIEALEQTLAAKHCYTEGHSRRVSDLSAALARAAGLPQDEVRAVELAARFHDIGKIGIRDDVLNKRGPLTDGEIEHIRTHPLVAERILSPIDAFAAVLPLVKHEHERFDGNGYPDGLRGGAIPLGARIIAIADTYDALVTDRVYRRGCSAEAALAEIGRCAGTQFDPHLVELFARLAREGALAPEGGKATPAARDAGNRQKA